MEETRRLYGVLDRRLADREFVADAVSVADFAILGWAWRHERHKVSFSDFPNVGRWYDALMARPGVKRDMEAKLDLTPSCPGRGAGILQCRSARPVTPVK